jgi:TRAP-type C4-dicarboxylate transport system permease small subunit
MELLRRIDRGISRGEAAVAAAMLLAMIVVAASQAVLRNLTNTGAGWANEALMHIAWADQFLQKGTLWLAFLGASLAVHGNKHIGIDVLSRISPPVLRSLIHGITGVAAGVICFYLAKVFYMSIVVIAADIPLDYEVLLPSGGRGHLCDVAGAEVASQGIDRPDLFCAVRHLLAGMGIPATTPENAMQLIVPPALLLMSVRFVLKGLGSFVAMTRGGERETEVHELPGVDLEKDEA